MKLKTWIGLAIIFGLVGCASDDQPQENSPKLKEGSFVAVGEDLNNVFQYNYNAVSKTAVTFDLTQDIDVPADFLALRQRNEFLSFFSFSEGRFSLALKNIVTGQTNKYPDFYTNNTERSIAWGVHQDSEVFFAYLERTGSRNLGILELDLTDSNETEITIDFNIADVFEPLFYEEMLFISYIDAQGNYKLTAYNTATKAVGTILNFQSTPISLLISDVGDLVVLKGQPQTELEKYDSKTLAFLEKTPLNARFGFLPGPIEDMFLVDEQIFFNLEYAQPSRLFSAPATYDLVSQETKNIDLFALVEKVEEEIGQPLRITTQIYDKSEQVFLIGYGTFDDNVLGGVFQASLEGDLLHNITFPFFPSYFVRD
ncbi:hypothetical protein [Flagellimonas sp. 2504JD1-5]